MPFLIGIILAPIVAAFARVAGLDRGKVFYPVVLIVVAHYYVLFAVMSGGGPGLVTELIGFAIFTAVAVWGFQISPWIVVAGLAGHGVFDFVRHNWLPGQGVPDWWPGFCGGFDVAAAVVLAAILMMAGQSSDAR